MRMVKESKNERLTMLLEETNKLLVNLGAAVQRQKVAGYSDALESLKDSEAELDASSSGTPGDFEPEEEADITDSDRNDDSSDLLEGQRQYNSAIHAIQEKVKHNLCNTWFAFVEIWSFLCTDLSLSQSIYQGLMSAL